MSRKLTYEFVKEQFEKENYILVSTEYIEAHNKLDYICPKGHKHSIKWSHWQQGYRCPYCAGLVKFTLEQIRESFNNEGYSLVSKEYINSGTKLDYICSKGHKHSICWDNWKQGKRCPTCDKINFSLRHIGDKNHQWKGGISCEPYCQDWTKEYKDFIKERDGYKCLNPMCNRKINKLCVHHIDYNKKNCQSDNLITICTSCNSAANTDREWHKVWYQSIIYRRYMRKD
jgi:hypothetical protein